MPTEAQQRAAQVPADPSTWLLARFDRTMRQAHGPTGNTRRRGIRGGNHERALFDVINDHAARTCEAGPDGDCFWMAGCRWTAADDELAVVA